jgi:serine/threonine-protein kinase HipA
MLIGKVYSNTLFVGILYRENEKVIFEYAQSYIDSSVAYDISVNLPIKQKKNVSEYLHPFFSNMLSEGSLRKIQCSKLGIDEEDDFMVAIHTTEYDTIGAITIKPYNITNLSEVRDEMS